MKSLSKEKTNKTKSYFNKKINFSQTIPKNGGNYEEFYNHNSISHIEICNENINLIQYSYRNLNQ